MSGGNEKGGWVGLGNRCCPPSFPPSPRRGEVGYSTYRRTKKEKGKGSSGVGIRGSFYSARSRKGGRGGGGL